MTEPPDSNDLADVRGQVDGAAPAKRAAAARGRLRVVAGGAPGGTAESGSWVGDPVDSDTVLESVALDDFVAYMPAHTFIYVPTREHWPAASVDGRLPQQLDDKGKRLKPSTWLDRNRPVEQMVWDPNEPTMIHDKVMQVGGYAEHLGATIFNMYRPPEFKGGDSWRATPWLEHLQRILPDDADHVLKYLAYKVQNPGKKINHALVIGGGPGIGKDTLLEPVKAAVGAWNWQDISPAHLLGRFNGFAKCVMLRISEARDLGEVDRFAFYEHSKTYLAAPPDVIRVDEKNLREHYVANVCGVVITTNHKTDGLYVPADDRRHYIAWSDAEREQFDAGYWPALYAWYADGGIGHVIAHLLCVDLKDFDPKAPPPKTAAFWAIVQANDAPESGPLRDVLDHLRNPDVITLFDMINAAGELELKQLKDELEDRRARRSISHKFERVGYIPVRNPDAQDGLFKVLNRRQVIYAKKTLPLAQQVTAATLRARRPW